MERCGSVPELVIDHFGQHMFTIAQNFMDRLTTLEHEGHDSVHV